MTMHVRRLCSILSLVLLLGLCRLAAAHPMGNFSVNHYSKIALEGDRIRIRYFIDLAEIPTFQELQQANIATTAIDPHSEAVINYVAARGADLGRGLALVELGHLHHVAGQTLEQSDLGFDVGQMAAVEQVAGLLGRRIRQDKQAVHRRAPAAPPAVASAMQRCRKAALRSGRSGDLGCGSATVALAGGGVGSACHVRCPLT